MRDISHGELLHYDVFSSLCHEDGAIFGLDITQPILRPENRRNNDIEFNVKFAENEKWNCMARL